LQAAGTQCEAADRHYEYELRAHKVNFLIENVGSSSFDRGTLVLDIPNVDGVEIPSRISPQPGCPIPRPEDYPAVEVSARGVRVQASVVAVPAGAKVAAFREPLRMCFRERAAGVTVPIEFTVYGRSLRKPAAGVLRIEIMSN
ncbi:MAG TPA: hypothetical protein VLD39_00570, partial [Gammaproteobacteria bacterium]|nr:hypothetical protein [Gammaproteobacteria bacterium]